MKEFERPPWDQPDAATWRVYADWLNEQGLAGPRARKDWLRALRFSVGLERRPQMCLVGVDWTDHLLVKPGSHNWKYPANLRWWTPRYTSQNSNWLTRWTDTIDKPLGQFFDVTPYLATPLDFPGMTDDASWKNQILIEFYWRVSYDVQLFLEDDQVWLRRRGRTPQLVV